MIGDIRNDGSYLRTTWHVEGRVFVVSTWNDQVCTGAIRIPVEGAAELVGLLADGLAEASVTPVESAAPTGGTTATGARGVLGLRRDLEAWVQQARTRLGKLILGRPRQQETRDPEPPPSTSSPPRLVADDEQRWTA
jgi:hypothetical protein